MSKETLISIAQRTRFSVSTVSRVLSGQAAKYRISEKTVALISHEAERCNYTPSLLAKGLRTSRTDTLGLLIPSIDNPYFAHIASIIVHEARTKGYKVILIDTSEDEHNEREGIRSLLSRKVDGILIAPAGDDPSFLETTARQTPVVCIDRHFAKTSLPYVVTDNLRGGREATQHLIDRGHRRILCIQGVRHSIPSADRVRGYRQALDENGLGPFARVVGDGFSIRNGYEQTLRALHARQRPTAIFALSNTILLGALRAVRQGRNRATQEDFEESVEVVIAGQQRKSTVLSDHEKQVVSYHEIGHAIVAANMKEGAPVTKITIVPRTSGALGYTMQVEEDEKFLTTRQEALDKLAVYCGGRAAEELIFGEMTTGAANDIEQATKLARNMITRFGMSEEFGMMALGTVQNAYLNQDTSLTCAPGTAERVDEDVRKLIEEAHTRAMQILKENKFKLHELARYLYKKETITGDEFMTLLKRENPLMPPKPTA